MFKQFNSLVDDIYAAATNFSYWEEIIEKLANITQSSSSVFLVVNNKKPELTYGEFLLNVDPDHRRLYESGYYNKIDKFSMQLGKLSGKVIHSDSAISRKPELFLQPEVESDFFQKLGYAHRIGFAIQHGDNQHICLYLNRSKKDGDYVNPSSTIKLLEMLSPHIKRSLLLSERLTIKDSIVNCLTNDFSGNSSGIIFLDKKGEIIYINDTAEQLFSSYSHILSYTKTLSLKNQDRRLENYIQSAIQPSTHNTKIPGGALSVAGKKPGHYLDILVTPVKLSHFVCTYFKYVSAAIFLTPSKQQFSCNKTLQQLYRLTPTEASILVDFINQPDLKTVCNNRSANIQTIRSQFKTIMHKMNIRKQTELLIKVLVGPCAFMSNDTIHK